MFPRRSKQCDRYAGDKLVTPAGLYLAVCDFASPFNHPDLFKDAWNAAELHGEDQLWAFNSFVVAEMKEERAVAWLLLLWGTFRLRVQIHARLDTMPFAAVCESLVDELMEVVLSCPTGKLGWVDVEASAWCELCVVPPGRYLARLAGRENPRHWELGPDRYPPGDDDWTLHLSPLR